ncbi:hypothetical protein P4132_20855 [Pseudomonas aeruginosa]|nr:hypothetical protein [Pseudomonas aeruginosa]
MNGYVGLRDDRRDGERLAARIGLLFPGPRRPGCNAPNVCGGSRRRRGLGVRRGWPASTGAD